MRPVPPPLAAALADRYRLERELGAGGMATVYLAHDTRHDRMVALKVLRPELSAVIGAERFLVEIKTTANLQHPHILALYDSGQLDGTVFYVMPFVEGESLRDKLAREKQLPVAEAIRIATEVAGALDYAHRHGVIHRDIKPENILLHDGRALVADFGIALAASRTEGGSRMTETGMSLGTPHYMSPEQALGERNLDARADVYALGCVLHEMLAGEPPFTGPTAQAVIARVMSGEPAPVTELRKTVPAEVEDAILTALAKLPADRFGSAAEFADALSGAGGAGSARTAATGRGSGRSGRVARARGGARFAGGWRWPAAFALAAGVALWGWMRAPAAVDPIPSRLAIPTPSLGDAGVNLLRMLDISPDGRTMLWVEVRDGRMRTVRRSLGDLEATEVEGSMENYASMSISPDGREFFASSFARSEMFRVPMDGGAPRPLPAGLAWSNFGVWSSDGTLWLTPQNDRERGIARISPAGEVTYPLRTLDPGMTLLQILPGDRHALATRSPQGTSFGPSFLIDLSTGEAAPLLRTDVVQVRYAAGHLVYALPTGILEAAPFDLRTLRTTGSPVTLATDVALTGAGQAQYAVAENGTIIYIPDEPRSLVFIDRAGNSRPALEERRNYHIPRFSPDGRRLLVDFTASDGRDVWQLNLDGGALTRVTFDRDGHDATWDPDGIHVTYISALRSGGALSIYRTRPGRAAEVDSLFSSTAASYTGVWLPDGSGLLTAGNSLRPGSQGDIALIRDRGRGPLEPVVATRFEESYPAVSPDGKWFAYTSNQSGTAEVFVRPLRGDGDQLMVSRAGGTEPMWSRTGTELFYREPSTAGAQLVAARLRLGPAPVVLERRRLFSVSDIVSSAPHSNYDVSPDGRTFAMVRQNLATRIVVIQHFPVLVRQLQSGAARR